MQAQKSPCVTDDVFHGQFLLTTDKQHIVPARFIRHSLNGWTLFSHESLTVFSVINSGQKKIGFVLGFPIQNGQPVCGNPVLNDTQRFLYETSGRYLLILLEGSPSAYPDPFCSLSAVYSRESKLFASTTSLLHYDAKTKCAYPRRATPHPFRPRPASTSPDTAEDCCRITNSI